MTTGKYENLVDEIYDMFEQISTSLDTDENLKTIVLATAKMLRCKGCSIRLLSPDGKTLKLKVACGLSSDYLEKGPIKVDKSPVDKRTLQGEIVCIDDVVKEDLFQYPMEAHKEGIVSVLSVPLKAKDHPIGVLRAYSKGKQKFTELDKKLVAILSLHSGNIIENSNMYERMFSLFEVNRDLSSIHDIDTILKKIVRASAEQMFAMGSVLIMYNKKNEKLEPMASWGLKNDFINNGTVKMNNYLRSCLKGRIVIVEDISLDDDVENGIDYKKEGIVTVINIPLIYKENVTGVLTIYFTYPRKFKDDEVDFLFSLANHGAIAIENARTIQHIRKR